jgi:hypothetical protein
MKNSLKASIIFLFSFNLLAAQYEVPVSPDLIAYSTFLLSGFDKKLDGDEVTIKYHLPKMLVGSLPIIKLTGKIVDLTVKNQEFELNGEFGEAKCVGSYATMKCVVEYHDLEVNEAQALQEIKSQSLNLEEEEKRIQVMKAFSTDPVGIITY